MEMGKRNKRELQILLLGLLAKKKKPKNMNMIVSYFKSIQVLCALYEIGISLGKGSEENTKDGFGLFLLINHLF